MRKLLTRIKLIAILLIILTIVFTVVYAGLDSKEGKVVNVKSPTDPNDAVNLEYLEDYTGSTYAPIDHNITSTDHGDAVADAVTRGSLIVGNSTPKWDELDIGDANDVLLSDGTDAVWISLSDLIVLPGDTIGWYVRSITNGTSITGGDGGSEAADLTLDVADDSIDGTELADSIDLDADLNIESDGLFIGNSGGTYEDNVGINVNDPDAFLEVLGATGGSGIAADSNAVALWLFEGPFPGTFNDDSVGTDDISGMGSDDIETTYFKEGSQSSAFESSVPEFWSILDNDLSADFPMKSAGSERDMSIVFWIRPTILAAEGETKAMVSKWWDVGNKRCFITTLKTVGGVGQFTFSGGYNSGTQVESFVHTGTSAEVDKWYHVAYTYQNSDGAFRIRVYDEDADTVTETTGNFSNAFSITSGTGAGFSIGERHQLPGRWYFDGYMDKIAVFNDVLSAAEIDQLRQGTFGGTSSYGKQLKLSYDSNNWVDFSVQGDGDIIIDSNKVGYDFDVNDGNFKTSGNLIIGSTQWNTGDSIDGENIANNTIDDDSIDFGTGASQVSASDMPNEDLGDLSISGGSYTLDVNTVAAEELLSGDYGDLTIDGAGAITIDDGALTVNELANVDTTGIGENKILKYDGTNWVIADYDETLIFDILTFSDANDSPQEIGTSTWKAIGTLKFTASYDNGPPDATPYVVLAGAGASWVSNLDMTTSPAFEGPTNSTEAVTHRASVGDITFTLNGNVGGQTDTEVETVTFWNRRHWGISSEASGWDSTDIGNLANNELSNSIGKTFSITAGSGEYILYSYATRLGTANFTAQGLKGGFVNPATVSHTNDSGFVENFYVYRSRKANLGTLSITAAAD